VEARYEHLQHQHRRYQLHLRQGTLLHRHGSLLTTVVGLDRES
jgi:hypothetical protein